MISIFLKMLLISTFLLLRELREGMYLLRNHVFFLPWIDVPFWFRYAYFWNSPYDISRKWMKDNGFEVHSREHSFTFGSTPLKTWDMFIQRAGIEKGDVVYDIGCGTGLACFFLARRLESRIVGIDYNEEFIARADWVREKINVHNPVFIHSDARTIDFSDADVVYMFSTTFTKELMEGISRRLRETLIYGATVISVSEPLQPSSAFQVVEECKGEYFFGPCTVYIHRYIEKQPIAPKEETITSSFSDILTSKQQR